MAIDIELWGKISGGFAKKIEAKEMFKLWDSIWENVEGLGVSIPGIWDRMWENVEGVGVSVPEI